MDGARGGSDYVNGLPNRRKKIQIISTNKVESFKRQNYQYTNPYSLNRNPSTPFMQRTPTTPDTMSQRDNLTQTSSQKSAKLVRTNGLSKAEKPNLTQSRAVSKPVVHRVSGSKVGPVFSSGHSDHDHNMSTVYQQYGIKPNIQYQSPQPLGPSHEEHMRVRQQNIRLREQITRMERNHHEEINSLKEQIDRIFRMTGDLEERIKGQDRDWDHYCKQHQIYGLGTSNK